MLGLLEILLHRPALTPSSNLPLLLFVLPPTRCHRKPVSGAKWFSSRVAVVNILRGVIPNRSRQMMAVGIKTFHSCRCRRAHRSNLPLLLIVLLPVRLHITRGAVVDIRRDIPNSSRRIVAVGVKTFRSCRCRRAHRSSLPLLLIVLLPVRLHITRCHRKPVSWAKWFSNRVEVVDILRRDIPNSSRRIVAIGVKTIRSCRCWTHRPLPLLFVVF